MHQQVSKTFFNLLTTIKMKRILFVVSVLASVITQSFAQNPAYISTMEKAIGLLAEFENTENNKQAVSQLERIAAAETTEWLPNYWAAYGLANLSFAEVGADKKDIILEKAEKYLATAEKMQPNNDEIEVLKAYIANARMAVSPQDRWQNYGEIVRKGLKNATKLNSENPRAALLAGQGIFYTPEAFGGGKKKSEPMLQDALVKFAKFKPASSIAPNWGERVAKWLLSQI